MQTLDLHGTKHADVEKQVEEFILLSSLSPLRIITGNSIQMKKLVTEVLDKYNFEYSDFGASIICSIKEVG